jgi:hypothetical protein
VTFIFILLFDKSMFQMKSENEISGVQERKRRKKEALFIYK